MTRHSNWRGNLQTKRWQRSSEPPAAASRLHVMERNAAAVAAVAARSPLALSLRHRDALQALEAPDVQKQRHARTHAMLGLPGHALPPPPASQDPSPNHRAHSLHGTPPSRSTASLVSNGNASLDSAARLLPLEYRSRNIREMRHPKGSVKAMQALAKRMTRCLHPSGIWPLEVSRL
jgi:hypothetical protein